MNAQNDRVNRLVNATTQDEVRKVLKEIPPSVYKSGVNYLGVGLLLLIVGMLILAYLDKGIPEVFVALAGVIGGAFAGLFRGPG